MPSSPWVDNKTLGRKLVQDIKDFKYSKFGIDDLRCSIKGACNPHDHAAFEAIETPQRLDATNPNHQAIMAMRAAFVETAFLSNTIPWIANRRRRHRSILLELMRIESLKDSSQERLRAWIKLITEDRTNEVLTEHRIEKFPIRMAACGTYAHTKSVSPESISIMPRTDGMTDILISTRAGATRYRTKQETENLEGQLELIELLKERPSEGIKRLMRITDQIFLNPEQYEGASALSEKDKLNLEEDIAGFRATESLSPNPPTEVRRHRKGT